MPPPRGSVAALFLAAALCAAQGAVTRHDGRYDTGPGSTLSLSHRQHAGLARRVVRAAEDESSRQQQVVGDPDQQTVAAADDVNAVDEQQAPAGADAGPDAAPPEVLVPADPAGAGGGRPRGHYHYHDKAGCFGYGYGRSRPVIIVVNNTSSSSDDSGDSEQLRAAPRSRRGRSRGRRAAPAPTPTAPGDATPVPFSLWLYSAAADRSRAARTPLARRLGVPTEVLQPYAPQHKTANDLEFNDLDHQKLQSRLEDDGRERVKREAEDPEGLDENETEVVPEPSILDYSIKDLVKRCVNSILGTGTGTGKSTSGGVSIARDGVAVGRAAVEGGIQVAKMVVQAFRELGASSSLVGRQELSPQDLPEPDTAALSALEGGGPVRDRRDAIQNVRKNLKNKMEVIMSRSNDVTEKVNDKMDSMFGDNAMYVKAKEMIMGAVGKVLQAAAKVSSSSSSSSRRRRRRATAEEPVTATPPRPRRGMAAILARVLEDMDNIPGRRVAKMVSTPSQPDAEPLEDGDEPAAALAGAQGEAADLLAPRPGREKRAAGAFETTTAALAAEGDATTEDSEEEKDDVVETESRTEKKGGQDIGKELGVRRRRAASPAAEAGAVRLRRDLAEDVKNATEKFMQRGREMFMKAKKAFEEAVRKAQEAVKGRGANGAGAGAGAGPAAGKEPEPSDKKQEKPSDMPAEKPDEPEDLSDDAEQTKHTARRRSLPDSDANGILGHFKTEMRLTKSIADGNSDGEYTSDFSDDVDDDEQSAPSSSLNFLD